MAATPSTGRKGQDRELVPGSRSAQKRRDILAVASELFLEKGFDGVSLDDIIAAIGGSKTTIYSYFDGKEGVLIAAVSALCEDILAKLFRSRAFGMPVREALQRIGLEYLDAVLSPRAVALQRLVIGVANRYPEAGRIWFESGPVKTYRLFTEFFEERKRSGELAVADPRTTAVLFHDMLTYEIHQQLLVGIMAKPKRAVLSRKVSSVVNLVLLGCPGG